jgi:integrase
LGGYREFNRNLYRSLARIGRRPPKPVVVGSNPTPPAAASTHPQFETYLKQYMREITAKSYVKRVRFLSKLGDLNDTEKIKTLICIHSVSEGRKELLAYAYDYYCQFNGLSWVKPKFTREDKPIFLPLETELDQLIANTREKLSVFLQVLKETGVDPGEAWKIEYRDIDVQRKTIAIRPTKNHSSRTLPVSENLLSRLYKLPRKNDRVFAAKNLDKLRGAYERARNNLSKKLGNPRLHEIAFKTFRHWKATMEYHRTKDILHVQWLLGHKRLSNTLIYTHLVSFESDEYTCKVAKSIEEASKLIEAGFEYVTEMDGIKLFRKRK